MKTAVQQYTEISKEDFQKFLRAQYNWYRPKEVVQDRGEVVFDIPLSDHVSVRVFSSITKGSGIGKQVGKDAIRTLLFSTTRNQPLNKKAAGSIVKRTQGWRGNLSDRIDSFIEEYEHKKDFYDSIAVSERPVQQQQQNPQYSISQPQQRPEPQQVKPSVPSQNEDKTDPNGTYHASKETAEKWNRAFQEIIRKNHWFASGYIKFLEDISRNLIRNGKWSITQKKSADKALLKFLKINDIGDYNG